MPKSKQLALRGASDNVLFEEECDTAANDLTELQMRQQDRRGVTAASFSSQASSANAGMLLSDLGRMGGRQRQSILRCTFEMTEMIRLYSQLSLPDNVLPQTGLLHPNTAEFK